MPTESEEIDSRRRDIVFDDYRLLGGQTNLYESLLSAEFSSGIDLSTQLTLRVIDPGFSMTRNQYFAITREVFFRSEIKDDAGITNTSVASVLPNFKYQHLEIAAASCDAGEGTSPIWTLECRTRAIQQMRRDKNPSSILGNGKDFVVNAGKRYKLGVVAESTDKTKTINKASNDRRADSLWDVISGLASESKFVTFETNGILFFSSQKNLIGLWGANYETNIDPVFITAANAVPRSGFNVVHLRWPSAFDDVFKLVQLPSMRRSDNDPLEVQGSALVDRAAGASLRPGMTIMLSEYPGFVGLYLISNVSYNVLTNDPVRIEFRTAEREDKDISSYKIGPSYDPFRIQRGF